jgi:hypothetical protein
MSAKSDNAFRAAEATKCSRVSARNGGAFFAGFVRVSASGNNALCATKATQCVRVSASSALCREGDAECARVSASNDNATCAERPRVQQSAHEQQ